MKVVRLVLRLICYLFSLAAGLFLFAIGFVGSVTGKELYFELVPGVEPEWMPLLLIGIGAFCFIALILLLSGPGTAGGSMLFAWNLAVWALLLWALARPSYRFSGPEHFEQFMILFFVSLAALAGSWSAMRSSGATEAA